MKKLNEKEKFELKKDLLWLEYEAFLDLYHSIIHFEDSDPALILNNFLLHKIADKLGANDKINEVDNIENKEDDKTDW